MAFDKITKNPFVRRLVYYGRSRFCPLCASRVRKFAPKGRRTDAECPVCGSLERHRMVYEFLRTRTPIFDRAYRAMLHIAPEPWLARRLKNVAEARYVAGDLSTGPGRTARFDLSALPFRDSSFDFVYCSHVLEHVPDDTKAMRELHRVMTLGGVALILVPMKGESTYEDWTIVSRPDRERAFGSPSHVRRYGMDIVRRLEAAGFDVTTEYFGTSLDDGESTRMGIRRTEPIFVCRR